MVTSNFKLFLFRILALSTFLFYSNTSFAQDIILKQNTDEIKCKVTEVALNVVKYKNWENMDGPVYSISKEEIFMIKYENGEKDGPFGTETPSLTTTVNASKPTSQYIKVGASIFNYGLWEISSAGETGNNGTLFISMGSNIGEQKRLSVETSFAYGFANVYDIPDPGFDAFDATFRVLTFMGKFDYHWKAFNNGSLYSGAGFGYTFGVLSIDDSDPTYSEVITIEGLAWQADLIGIRYDFSPHVGMFGELGFGRQGIFQTGLQINW